MVMDDQLDMFEVVEEILVFLIADAMPDNKPKDKRIAKTMYKRTRRRLE